MSWEPLAPSNPVPGDPEVSARAGAYYSNIAADMDAVYSALGVIHDLEGFESDAVKALRDKADDIRKEVVKAKGRYEAAGAALTTYAWQHENAQAAAADLLRRAVDAQGAIMDGERDAARAKENLNDGIRATRNSGAALDPHLGIAVRNANAALTSSRQALTSIIGELPEIVSTWHGHASDAADKISEAVERDDLNDGWWEKWGSGVAHFLSKWAGRIATIAGVAALALAWVPVLGEVLGVIALVAGAIKLVADFSLLLAGEANVGSVLVDLLSVLSFGVGGAVARVGGRLAAKGLAQGISRGARVAANARRIGNPAARALARNAWATANRGFREVPAVSRFGPASWFRAGKASFSGLKFPSTSWFMNAMGHSDAARTFQALRNAHAIEPFARNATGYVETMSRLGSLNMLKGGFGTQIANFTLGATLSGNDVRTWQ